MDFYQRVAVVCGEIPRGKVVSYGQIALLCGMPRNARQVGYALRMGRSGDVPAHRVVNSQGYLSGAASFSRPDTQRKLLKAEGVAVSEENRVDLKRDGWKNTMEDALRLRAVFEERGI